MLIISRYILFRTNLKKRLAQSLQAIYVPVPSSPRPGESPEINRQITDSSPIFVAARIARALWRYGRHLSVLISLSYFQQYLKMVHCCGQSKAVSYSLTFYVS